jgi:hypothetical protein
MPIAPAKSATRAIELRFRVISNSVNPFFLPAPSIFQPQAA